MCDFLHYSLLSIDALNRSRKEKAGIDCIKITPPLDSNSLDALIVCNRSSSSLSIYNLQSCDRATYTNLSLTP